MAYIEIENMWTDSDGMVQLDVSASNGRQVMRQDFYYYPNELLEFCSELKSFPNNINDEVILEYGKEEDFYSYFLLKAVVIDNVGHSAFELAYNNRNKPPDLAKGRFYIEANPGSINSFGDRLSAWISDMREVFLFDWSSA